MPATETTPEQWAEGFYSSFGDEHYSQACIRDAIAELADLKRRADQADRMREAILPLMDFLQGFAEDHEGDVRDYFPALAAALKETP